MTDQPEDRKPDAVEIELYDKLIVACAGSQSIEDSKSAGEFAQACLAHRREFIGDPLSEYYEAEIAEHCDDYQTISRHANFCEDRIKELEGALKAAQKADVRQRIADLSIGCLVGGWLVFLIGGPW